MYMRFSNQTIGNEEQKKDKHCNFAASLFRRPFLHIITDCYICISLFFLLLVIYYFIFFLTFTFTFTYLLICLVLFLLFLPALFGATSDDVVELPENRFEPQELDHKEQSEPKHRCVSQVCRRVQAQFIKEQISNC